MFDFDLRPLVFLAGIGAIILFLGITVGIPALIWWLVNHVTVAL